MHSLARDGLPYLYLASASMLPDRISSGVLWIVGLVGAAIAFNQLVQGWNNLTRNSASVSGASEARKRSDCIEIHKVANTRMKDIEGSIDDSKTSLRLEIKKDIDGVHRRIDDLHQVFTTQSSALNSSLGEIRGELKRMNNGRPK